MTNNSPLIKGKADAAHPSHMHADGASIQDGRLCDVHPGCLLSLSGYPMQT